MRHIPTAGRQHGYAHLRHLRHLWREKIVLVPFWRVIENRTIHVSCSEATKNGQINLYCEVFTIVYLALIL